MINYDILFINTLSQEANLFINKKLLAKYGLDLAVFISFLTNQYNYFLNTNQLTEEKMFFATDEDIFLFTNMPRSRITSIKKEAQQLGLIEIKKIGQPAKSFYKMNFELLLSILSGTETIKELAYARVLKEDTEVDEEYIRNLSFRELRLFCKKLELSYSSKDLKDDLINLILEYFNISKNEKNSNFCQWTENSSTEKEIPVDRKVAHKWTENLSTSGQKSCHITNINKHNINKHNINIHDHEDENHELDFFENLFKEKFKVNFTETNKKAIGKLRKKMSFKETVKYLEETYEGIKQNEKFVKNIPALFSSKILKGERQLEIKKIKTKVEKEDSMKSSENTVENKIVSEEEQLLEKYRNLSFELKTKLKERAIQKMLDTTQISKEFIQKMEEDNPAMYKGLIKNYILEILKEEYKLQ